MYKDVGRLAPEGIGKCFLNFLSFTVAAARTAVTECLAYDWSWSVRVTNRSGMALRHCEKLGLIFIGRVYGFEEQ